VEKDMKKEDASLKELLDAGTETQEQD